MFELSIHEYEDREVLGTYKTRKKALIALGEYVLEHPHAQFLYPAITEL